MINPLRRFLTIPKPIGYRKNGEPIWPVLGGALTDATASPADFPVYKQAFLAADNALGTGDTFEDVVTLGTLVAGTYMIWGQIIFIATAANEMTGKILVGSVAVASAQLTNGANLHTAMPLLPVIYHLQASAIVKSQAAASSTTSTILEAPTNNTTGLAATGSYLAALRIA